MRPPLVIGLTGGIASGKTAASRCFEQLGVPVIDADLVARDVVEPGRAGLAAVVEEFGREVLDSKGRLDRRRLRKRVFDKPERREKLESILHPLIKEEMLSRLSEVDHDYAVLIIPLLLEAGQTELVDRILVIDAPESEQIERTRRRDGVSEEEVHRIMSAQTSRKERLARADDVIENTGTLEELRSRVAGLDELYRSMSRAVANQGG